MPLGGAAGIVGAGGPGQGDQGGADGLAGLGVQQPVHGDHAVVGGRQPQPPPLQAHPGTVLGGVGVEHAAQVGGEPAQAPRIKPPGRVHQHPLRLRDPRRRQVMGGVGQHDRVLDRHLPGSQRPGGHCQGAVVQRPGNADLPGGGGGAHAQGGAQPPRRRLRPDAAFGAGGATGVHGGEPAQADSLELVGQPPQRLELGGDLPVAELGRVIGGHLGDGGGQPFQPRRQPARRAEQPFQAGGQLFQAHRCRSQAAAEAVWRTGVRVHGARLAGPASAAQIHHGICG
jgi:hypothetical protein